MEQANGQARNQAPCIEDIGLISIERQGMTALFDLVGRALLTAARLETRILMLSQSSSEANFCLAVPRSQAPALVDALRDELQPEIARRSIVALHARHDVALLSVRAVSDAAGCSAAQLCESLAMQDINILAFAQTHDGCSAIIEAVYKDRAASVLYRV